MYRDNEGMLRILRTALALGATFASGSVLAAVASIAEIQLVEGEAVVELTGSGFGAGPKVAFFDDFEAGDEGDKLGTAPIRVGTLSVNRPPVYTSYGVDRQDTGVLIRDRTLATNLQLLQASIEFPQTTEIFMHYAVHIPPGNSWPTVTDGNLTSFGTVSSWKFAWIMDGSKGDSCHECFDMCVPSHVGHGIAAIGGNSGKFTYAPKFGEWWDWEGVNHVSYWFSKSKTSPDPTVGEAYWRSINKAVGLKEVIQEPKKAQEVAEIKFDRVKIPGWFRANDLDQFNAVYDNIYVATGPNSIARIEITDKASPEASSFVMVVPPLSWDDSRISFRVPAVVAKAREEFFVRVYTATGEKSDKSMRICLNCPRPPLLK